MKNVNNELTDKQKRIIEYAIQCRAENLSIEELLAKQIGAQGHVVICGLALGCDTAAHRGVLIWRDRRSLLLLPY